MRAVCIDVVISSAALRTAARKGPGRPVWLAMIVRIRGDVRWLAVADHHLREMLTYALFIEDLFGSPEAGPY